MEKLNNVSIISKTVGQEISFYYMVKECGITRYLKVSWSDLTNLDDKKIKELNKAIKHSIAYKYIRGITPKEYYDGVKECLD